MLRELRRYLGPDRASLKDPPWAVRNAVTESALLHARQLAEILLSTGYPTDIKLTEIMPGFQPAGLAALESVYVTEKVNDILNKYVMHPSILRTHMYDYTPTLQRLGDRIEDVVCEIERRQGTTAIQWMNRGKPVLTVSTNAVTHVSTTTTLP